MVHTQSGSSRDQLFAVVYCDGQFGLLDGKTANGLVRYSERYRITAVIDSTKGGLDCSEVLEGVPPGIPILPSLSDAMSCYKNISHFIFGIAPTNGLLSLHERKVISEAIACGLNIVSGLHEFLNDDDEFIEASKTHNVELIDIRKPRPKKDLRVFTGRVTEISCPRIAVLGTDSAIGKRTTARILTKALEECGIRTVMIGTGQTGLIQGAKYGVALDAVPSQFCAGELEATIIDAYENEHPDVIIVEGQGSLSHPAFSTSSFILRGSCPDGVILQHAPARKHRCDFPTMPMPEIPKEIELIETFSDTRVIGLTISHEHMTDDKVTDAISALSLELNLPVTDAVARPPDLLVKMVLAAFPKLAEHLSRPII